MLIVLVWQAIESWMSHGTAERQTSFLRMLLKMLANVPIPKAVVSSSKLPKLLTDLQKYRYRASGSRSDQCQPALMQTIHYIH